MSDQTEIPSTTGFTLLTASQLGLKIKLTGAFDTTAQEGCLDHTNKLLSHLKVLKKTDLNVKESDFAKQTCPQHSDEQIYSKPYFLLQSAIKETLYFAYSKGPQRQMYPLQVRALDPFAAKCSFPQKVGIRPVLTPEMTKNLKPYNQRQETLSNGEIIDVCQFGFYPYSISEFSTQQKANILQKTGTHLAQDISQNETADFEEVKTAEGFFMLPLNLKRSDNQSDQPHLFLAKMEPIDFLMDPTGYWVSKDIIANIEITPNWQQEVTLFLKNLYQTMTQNQHWKEVEARLYKETQQIPRLITSDKALPHPFVFHENERD